MAQVSYRANLSAAQFPLLAEDFGRSVIVPAQDNNFNRQVTAKEESDKDIGIPQMYYCHNVMPYAQGIQSVSYVEAISTSGANFKTIFDLRDDAGYSTFVGISYDSVTNQDQLWVYNGSNWVFKLYNPVAEYSTAQIQGKTYLYISYSGSGACLRYDFGTSAFVPVTLDGLTPADVVGISTAAGYMIAYSRNKVFWSSTLEITGDIVDFNPSLTTGAGSKSIEALKGIIITVAPHQMGFVVYASENICAAVYTQNYMEPFQFREIIGTGGISSASQISYGNNAATDHWAYTTSGLQRIGSGQAAIAHPEVTDFISGLRFEDYSAASSTFTHQMLTSPMKRRVSIIASRYLVISYGVTSLTHALVYDMAYKRWGKLRVNHVQCFEYNFPNTATIDIPRQSIGFLQDIGRVVTVDFRQTSDSSDSVVLLGRYQYVRARTLTLDELVIDSINPLVSVGVKALTHGDGRNVTAINSGYWVQWPANTLNMDMCKYLFSCTGMSHTIQISGSFRLSSVTMRFHIHGKV